MRYLKQLKKGKIKGIVRAYGFPILFGIIFACVLVYFVRPSQIEGESMEPTLKDGQLIFLFSIVSNISSPCIFCCIKQKV
jgi:signal peptidase I